MSAGLVESPPGWIDSGLPPEAVEELGDVAETLEHCEVFSTLDE
jgi:hypothetical protein